MNYISFFVGIAGFIFTLLTFNNTRRFKRLQIDIAERNDFRDSSDDFISQIEGAIASIQDDKLRSDTFRESLSQLLTDLESRYSFLPSSIKRIIKKLKKNLSASDVSNKTWSNIAEQLIKLKNSLIKERAVNG
jgi:hypothetical protein